MHRLPSYLLTFIRSRLPLVPVPFVPEIHLHKAGPKSGLWQLAEKDEAFGAPYWAHYWGGGLALARHILDHPGTVAGQRVLDLGAGSGIVGIAAAKSGANQVIAADIDRYAIAATRLNAKANGVAVATVCGDLLAELPPAVDVVLVGDLFYEEELAARVTAFLDGCLRAKIAVLVGDPLRAFLPLARLRLLAAYNGTDFGLGGEPSTSAVFAFGA